MAIFIGKHEFCEEAKSIKRYIWIHKRTEKIIEIIPRINFR